MMSDQTTTYQIACNLKKMLSGKPLCGLSIYVTVTGPHAMNGAVARKVARAMAPLGAAVNNFQMRRVINDDSPEDGAVDGADSLEDGGTP